MRIPRGNWLLPEDSVTLALVGKPLPRHSLPFSGGGQINSQKRKNLLCCCSSYIQLPTLTLYLRRVPSECVLYQSCA